LTEEPDEAIGCRPIVEALGVFAGLFVLGLIALFGSTPSEIGVVRSFVFFLGAPATGALSFLSPGGFALAWPIDVLVWTLAAVWAARATDRRTWWRRVGVAVGVAAVIAALAVV
jgi:hypothetical protein